MAAVCRLSSNNSLLTARLQVEVHVDVAVAETIGLEAAGAVESDRVLPVVGRFDHHPAVTAPSRLIQQMDHQPPPKAAAAQLARDGHSHEPADARRFDLERAGADDLPAALRYDHARALVDVAGGDVVKIGIQRFVDRAEVITQASQ